MKGSRQHLLHFGSSVFQFASYKATVQLKKILK